jgi:hypothetical protein
MIKKIAVSVFIFLLIAIAAAFFFRYQILQYSAEKLIRSSLPPYVKIDDIRFDFRDKKIVFSGFALSNPADFSYADMLEIKEISCKYALKGKNIMDGIELTGLVFKEPLLTIERLGNAKLNLTEMQSVLGTHNAQRSAKRSEASPEGTTHNETVGQSAKTAAAPNAIMGRKISDIIKLPRDFLLRDGKIVFVDRFSSSKPITITFENVIAKVSLRLNDSYTGCLEVSSTGEGRLNGNRDEAVKWVISYNPTTPRLTMSNRFEVSNLDLVALRPYYDRYSPLYFVRGRFSGTLIFDFDNGNIGSTNEVWLTDFRFYVKQGLEKSAFWETTVPDIVKYFSTPYGEIVFDFKIKGDMAHPQFYLGPISKQAMAAMAVDKIQNVISSVSESAAQAAGEPSSNIDKAKQYIDIIKGLIKK